MPIRIQVGLKQERGLPHDRILEASCQLEMEFADESIENDPQLLPRRLREAYSVCRSAITAELETTATVDASWSSSNCPSANSNPQNATKPAPQVPLATEAQIRALHAIAKRQGLDLHAEVLRLHNVHRVAQLTRQQASRLIDQMQPAAAS